MREATEKERLAHYNERFDTYLAGDNLLSFKLGKTVKIEISADERETFLARTMKIPDDPLNVELFWNGLLSAVDTSTLNKQEVKMHDSLVSPKVTLHFCHFACPIADGGWQNPNTRNPLFQAWSQFFAKHRTHIESGTNMYNLRDAHQESLPIDIAYSIYQGEMLKFHLLPPYPERQEGCKVYVKK